MSQTSTNSRWMKMTCQNTVQWHPTTRLYLNVGKFCRRFHSFNCNDNAAVNTIDTELRLKSFIYQFPFTLQRVKGDAIFHSKQVHTCSCRLALGGTKWNCHWKTRRTQKEPGYSNLLKHVQQKHPTELQSQRKQKPKTFQLTITSLPCSSEVISIYGLLCYITCWLRPFSIFENVQIKTLVNYKSLIFNTFNMYMQSLSRLVEKWITKILPSLFAIIFDVQTAPIASPVAIFSFFFPATR